MHLLSRGVVGREGGVIVAYGARRLGEGALLLDGRVASLLVSLAPGFSADAVVACRLCRTRIIKELGCCTVV